MPTPKFNFVPERQLGETPSADGNWYVTLMVSKVSPAIYFPSEFVKVFEMAHKYYRIYADIEKKSIAWTEVTEGLEEMNDSRQMNPNVKTGACILAIGKILKSMSYTPKEKVKLKVYTYTNALIAKPMQYVTLPVIEKPYVQPEEKKVDTGTLEKGTVEGVQ